MVAIAGSAERESSELFVSRKPVPSSLQRRFALVREPCPRGGSWMDGSDIWERPRALAAKGESARKLPEVPEQRAYIAISH